MPWSDILRRWRDLPRALARAVEGAAAVEFAIVVPAIGLVLAGAFDLAQLGNFGQTLDGALRTGASYAMTDSIADANYEAGITAAIQNYAACTGGQTAKNGCFPAGQPAVSFLNQGVATTYDPYYCTCDGDLSSSGTISCDNNVATCATGPKHVYVKIQAVWSGITPVMPLLTGMPTSITRTLTVRVL